ncbi:MAG: hypothetical protein WCA32_06765 [Chromatiaceae bacterium]|jgi:hypothetical protein
MPEKRHRRSTARGFADQGRDSLAHGPEESFDAETQRFGSHILQVIETVFEAVYQARGAPPVGGLRERLAPMLNDLLAHCLRQADFRHEKTRALARELLNDSDTFWVVLDHPELPLSRVEVWRGDCRPSPEERNDQAHACLNRR